MAAPVVAASAAMVRQYFASGLYPTMASVPSNAHSASGAPPCSYVLNAQKLHQRDLLVHHIVSEESAIMFTRCSVHLTTTAGLTPVPSP